MTFTPKPFATANGVTFTPEGLAPGPGMTAPGAPQLYTAHATTEHDAYVAVLQAVGITAADTWDIDYIIRETVAHEVDEDAGEYEAQRKHEGGLVTLSASTNDDDATVTAVNLGGHIVATAHWSETDDPSTLQAELHRRAQQDLEEPSDPEHTTQVIFSQPYGSVMKSTLAREGLLGTPLSDILDAVPPTGPQA